MTEHDEWMSIEGVLRLAVEDPAQKFRSQTLRLAIGEIDRLRAQLALYADTTPITEEWAATVRGDGVYLDNEHLPDGLWRLEYYTPEKYRYANNLVKFQGQVLGILNAVRPQKVGE